MEHKFSLPRSQQPTTFTIISQMNPVHSFSFSFLKIHVNAYLPFMPRSCTWSVTFTLPHQNPVCIHLLSPPYTLHAQPILPFILSPEQCSVSITNHEIPHYATVSSLLFHPTFQSQYVAATCCSTHPNYTNCLQSAVPPYISVTIRCSNLLFNTP